MYDGYAPYRLLDAALQMVSRLSILQRCYGGNEAAMRTVSGCTIGALYYIEVKIVHFICGCSCYTVYV